MVAPRQFEELDVATGRRCSGQRTVDGTPRSGVIVKSCGSEVASLAPEGVMSSPSSWRRGPWDQDLRPLKISAWHVLWWKATGSSVMDQGVLETRRKISVLACLSLSLACHVGCKISPGLDPHLFSEVR